MSYFTLFLEGIFYTLPTLVLGSIFAVYFKKIIASQNKANRYMIDQLTSKSFDTTSLRLQACERLVILIQRLELKNLLLRVTPLDTDKLSYSLLLIQHINQEVEYNVAQQIYVSDDVWQMLINTKDVLIQTISELSKQPQITDSKALSMALLQHTEILSQSFDLCLQRIKTETNTLL